MEKAIFNQNMRLHFLAVLQLILYGLLPLWPRVGAEGTFFKSKAFSLTSRSLILDPCNEKARRAVKKEIRGRRCPCLYELRRKNEEREKRRWKEEHLCERCEASYELERRSYFLFLLINQKLLLLNK